MRGAGERYPGWICVVWSTGDPVPLCQELPDGADAICSVPRVGNAGGVRDGCGMMGGGRPIIVLTNPTGCVSVGGCIDSRHCDAIFPNLCATSPFFPLIFPNPHATSPFFMLIFPKSGTTHGGGNLERCHGPGSHLHWGESVVWQHATDGSRRKRHKCERLSIWLWQHRQRMLEEDLAVNATRPRAVRATTVAVGQQEAQERHTKAHRKENARKRKRERQQTQRDA